MLAEAGLTADGTETDAYFRMTCERYRLMLTHEWSAEALERVRP